MNLFNQVNSHCYIRKKYIFQMKASLAQDMLSPGGQTKLLLATPAFGMGVDCPDIRRVVHAGVPSTLEGIEYVYLDYIISLSNKGHNFFIVLWKMALLVEM